MIERYSRPQMQRLWSEEQKFQTWLEIELAVVDAWSSLGKVPVKAAKEIRQKAGFEINRITELEKETHHDVVAFIETVSEKLGPLSAYFHLGLTSSDLLDTANALLLKEFVGRLKGGSVSVGPANAGIEVKVSEDNMTIDVTDVALKDLVARYIRKDFREILFRTN